MQTRNAPWCSRHTVVMQRWPALFCGRPDLLRRSPAISQCCAAKWNWEQPSPSLPRKRLARRIYGNLRLGSSFNHPGPIFLSFYSPNMEMTPSRASLAQLFQDLLGNVTFLERPFHPTTLANVARSALRARRRQYEARSVLDRQALLTREVLHRTKNLIAVIQSIASGSLRDDTVNGTEAFQARLHALANAQNILVDTDWRGAPMRDLVQAALGGLGGRVSLQGPPVFIKPSVAQGLALIVHELATNAAKHGAFTAQKGTVSVCWSVEDDASEPILHFQWQERGGPPAKQPERKGFGSVLLEHAVANLDNPPRLKYAPEGFTYELVASLAIAPSMGGE